MACNSHSSPAPDQLPKRHLFHEPPVACGVTFERDPRSTETGARIVEMPDSGRYLVELTGRTDETVGAWTFEFVVDD